MLTFLKPVSWTDPHVRSCRTAGENNAAARRVVWSPPLTLGPVFIVLSCFSGSGHVIFLTSRWFITEIPGCLRQSCGEGAVRAGIILFKSRMKKVLRHLSFQTHFPKIEESSSASDVALCRRTSAPLLRVRACIFDKHRTSQMFTKNVCQRVFGALTKSLEIWYVGLVDVFQPLGKC